MNKTAYYIGTGILLFATLVTVTILSTDRVPNEARLQSPEGALVVIASTSFSTLSPEQQTAYVRKAFAGESPAAEKRQVPKDLLSDRQLDRLKSNMNAYRAAQWKQRLNTYFALPPAEQVAFLDRLIAQEIEKTSPGKTKKRGGKENATGGPGRNGDKDPGDWMKKKIESTPPADRARSMEFKRVLRERREQRGLEPW